MNNRLDKNKIKWFPKPAEGNNRAPVFFHDNLVFRAIPKEHEQSFLDFFSSGLPDKLASLQLIPKTKISDFTLDGFDLLIEQELLPWTIYPQEWTFSMLQEAAKCVLNVNKVCLEYGYETYDCHGFNVLFNASCPQFIDIGSFVKKSTSIAWVAIDEFIRCYLYPLKLWSQGQFYLAHRILSDNHWKRFYPEDLHYQGGFEYLLKQKTDFDKLIQCISTFDKNDLSSLWKNYHDKYKQDGVIKTSPRFEKILDIVRDMDIKTVHDIGGNAGVFTRLLLENTQVEKSLCSDKDANAINSLFEKSCKDPFLKDKVSCALLNVMSPIQNYGNSSIYKRLECDAVFALALLHHLVLVAQTPLDLVLKNLQQYTNKYIFIEFMPFSHLSVQSRVIAKEVEYYTEEYFASEFKKIFDVVRIERLELNRTLFVGKIKTAEIHDLVSKMHKISEKIATPVLLIFQNEQDFDVLNKLENFEWMFLFVVINKKNLSSKLIKKIEAWLEIHCNDYEIIKISSRIKNATYYAIDCFFDKFEHGIIIESGLIPDPSFFKYCDDLLSHYHTKETVLQISGINFSNNSFYNDSSYIFTRSFFGGAFASWKKNWIKFKEFKVEPEFINSQTSRFFKYYSEKAIKNWQYRWMLFGIHNEYLSIQPRENLVKFSRKEGEELKYFNALSAHEMKFPLKHPDTIQVADEYDAILNADFFNPFLPFSRARLKLSDVSIALTAEFEEIKLLSGEKKQLKINVKNCGSDILSSQAPFPVSLSYQWLDMSGEFYVSDGLRSHLISPETVDLGGLLVPKYLFLFPDESRDYLIDVLAPDIPGCYTLKITAVQEGQFWFDHCSGRNILKIIADCFDNRAKKNKLNMPAEVLVSEVE